MPTEKRERQRAARQARREAELIAQRRAARRRQIVLSVLAVAAIVGGLFLFGFFSGGDESEDVATDDTTTTTERTDGDDDTTSTTAQSSPISVPPGEAISGETPCPPADGSAERTTKFAQPPPMCIDTAKTYRARVETDIGEFVVEFDDRAAPKTVNNFVVLARYHYYDGIVFHRVIKDFVIQGGDPTGTGAGDYPGYTFEDENLSRTTYAEGDIAMANSGPDTNGSQFFVIVSENGAKTLIDAQEDKKPHYTKFGKVISGFDVVKQIEADGGQPGDPNGAPAVLHRMRKVTIEEVD